MPFIAFIVTAVVTSVRLLPRPLTYVAGAVVGVAVLVALVVMPMRIRDQQNFLVEEATGYEVMVSSVQALCGEVPPGGQIYVKDPPYRDIYNIHTVSVLNLYYGDIDAHPVTELPELIAFVEPKCVVEFDPETGTYRRITDF